MNRRIPIGTHNVLDYVFGFALIISPLVFGFSYIEGARNTFLALGAFSIVYSAMTNYRYSLLKVIPLGIHMSLDVISGILLMMAPWIVGYSNSLTGIQLGAHFIFGLGVIGLVAFTYPRNEMERATTDNEVIDFRRAA